MELLVNNKEKLHLDLNLYEFEQVELSFEEFVFTELCKQLKIPYEYYYLESKDFILAEIDSKELQLDSDLFKLIEYSRIINPQDLLRYGLLLSYLNLEMKYSDVFLLSAKKIRFKFLNKGLLVNELETANFSKNFTFTYFSRKMKPKTIQAEIDNFLALLNIRYEEKLIQSMSFFQNITGDKINKLEVSNLILAQERLSAFEQFINKNFQR